MKKVIYIISSLILVFTMTSCKSYKEFSKTFFEDYFNTVITVYAYETNEAAFNRNIKLVEEQIDKYHKLYDIYYEYSGMNNICTINKSAGIAPVIVDKEIIDLLKYSKDIYEVTNGYVNVAMGSVLKLWHDAREYASDYPNDAYVPDLSELIIAAQSTDIESIIINEEESSVYINDPYTLLDVGAVAKGYACEQVAQMLIEKGAKYYTLNFGGNIRCIGTKADESPWKIGIQNPVAEDVASAIEAVYINNRSVVTSGSYQRYYYVGDKKYHHIINPDTLMPEDNFVSVSIITTNSALGDALSTALFNLSLEKGQTLIDSIDDTEAIWIDNAGTIYKSSGFDSYKG